MFEIHVAPHRNVMHLHTLLALFFFLQFELVKNKEIYFNFWPLQILDIEHIPVLLGVCYPIHGIKKQSNIQAKCVVYLNKKKCNGYFLVEVWYIHRKPPNTIIYVNIIIYFYFIMEESPAQRLCTILTTPSLRYFFIYDKMFTLFAYILYCKYWMVKIHFEIYKTTFLKHR